MREPRSRAAAGGRAARFVTDVAVGLAASTVAVAALVALRPWLGAQTPVLVPLCAVAAAAFLRGLVAGLTTLVACAGAGQILFVEPLGSLAVDDARDLLRLAIFALLGTVVAALAESRLRSEGRVDVAHREHVARLAAVLRSSADAVIVMDAAGRVVEWSDAATRTFGWSRAEALGRDVAELVVPPALRAEHRRGLARCRETDGSALRGRRIEVVGMRRDGDEFPCELTVSSVELPDGTPLFSAYARDVSDRRAAEAEREALLVRETRARAEAEAAGTRFRALVADVDAIVWEADPLTWRYGFVSERSARILGYPPARWLEEPGFWARVLHPEDRERAVATRRAACAEVRDVDFEYRVLAADGRVVWVRDLVRVGRGPDGRAATLRGLMVDVTERNELERRLRERAEELAEADRRKDEFLAVLGHELRNPLAPIGHGVELLARVHEPERVDEVVGILRRQVRQLVRLIDDLLDVSRIQAGRIELQRETVVLQEVVASAREAVEPLAAEAGLALEVAQPDEPLVVEGDPQRLAQVVSNLLSNAVRYTPSPGRVRVAVQRAAGGATVAVSDTGVGIPHARLDEVFEMFARVGNGLRDTGGLGIGLTIARRLAELHGGTLEAASEGEGRGSTFTLRLPLRPAVLPPRAPSAPRAALPRLSVLVVDDVPVVADTFAGLLQALGQEVRVAYDADGALEEIVGRRPDLVVTDLAMPGTSGYDLARRVRALPAPPALVALSGHGRAEDRRRTREAGFVEHLVKPVSIDDLRALLDRLGARLPRSEDAPARSR